MTSTDRPTRNARGDVQLLDDAVHDDTEVVVRSGREETQQENENNNPENGVPNARTLATTILKIATR